MEVFIDETLPVEVEQVEAKEADLHLDLRLHGVFALASGKNLGRLQ